MQQLDTDCMDAQYTTRWYSVCLIINFGLFVLPGVKTMKDFVFACILKHDDLDSFNEIPLDLKEMIKSFWENN